MTSSLLKPFLAGSATYFVSNVINAAIPFALLPVLTRYLRPDEYGEVAMFQTLLGGLNAFVGLSVAGAAGRKHFDDALSENELRQFLAACLQVLVASSAVALLAMYAFRAPLGRWLGLNPRWLPWGVFATAASVVLQLRLSQWQVRGQARLYGALQIFQSALNMVLSLLLVVAIPWGAAGRIGAYVAAIGVVAILALVLLHRDRLFAFFVWRPDLIKEALSYGVPLVPHVAGAFALSSVDRVVITNELGLSETGQYMVAVQLAGAMSIVFDAVNRAYTPWLFENLRTGSADRNREIVRFTYYGFGLLLLGAALAFVVGPPLVTWLAGNRYASAAKVIGVLFLGQAFMGMYLLLTGYVFYSKRTGLLSAATVASGTLNVLLLLVLIPWLGAVGAALAFCASMVIRFFLTWGVAQRRHPMPWFDSRVRS
jgi:O-antigen/teichoic acid export membrane protein